MKTKSRHQILWQHLFYSRSFSYCFFNVMFLCISELQQQILEALWRFGYATTDQLISLGIGKDRSYINKLLKQLRTHYGKPLIYTNCFGVHPKKGKLPSVHCLSSFGAKLLCEELEREKEQIRYTSVPQKLFQNDYAHRLACIQIHMNCYQRSQKYGYRILQYYHYFQKHKKSIAGHTYALTSFPIGNGKRLIADSVFLIQYQQEKAVFSLEFYNDKSVKRMYEQLEKYIEALSNGYPALSYKIQKNAQVLLVFRHSNVMELLQERLQQDVKFIPFKKLFLFKTLKPIESEVFWEGWEIFNHTKTTLQLPKKD